MSTKAALEAAQATDAELQNTVTLEKVLELVPARGPELLHAGRGPAAPGAEHPVDGQQGLGSSARRHARKVGSHPDLWRWRGRALP